MGRKPKLDGLGIAPSFSEGANPISDIEDQEENILEDSLKEELTEVETEVETETNIINSTDSVICLSPSRAGKSVYGSTGELISFNEKGEAKISKIEALHFKNIPDCEILE